MLRLKCLDILKCTIADKFTLFNSFLSAFVAFAVCLIIYKILLPWCSYSNLNDFYAGTSIFENHNKFLDLWIFPVYIVLFYIIYFFNKVKIPRLNIDINKYDKLFVFLSIIIGVISLIVFFPQIVYLDVHHYGEKFAAYWAHQVYGMQYYKDIMLVHGYMDILPSWIAAHFGSTLTIEKERICAYWINWGFCFINIILSVLIFRRRVLLICLLNLMCLIQTFISGMFSTVHCITFVLIYVLLLKYYDKLRPEFWFILCGLSMFCMVVYHTTLGTACSFAMLPLVIKKFREHKLIGTIAVIGFICAACYFASDEIISYLEKSRYYISSNLYAFGNNFPSHLNPVKLIVSLMIFFAVPYMINLLLVSPNKKIRFLAIYSIILACLVLNYALGRIDASNFVPRASSISIAFLVVIAPYILYLQKSKFYTIFNFLLILFFFSLFINISYKNYRIQQEIKASGGNKSLQEFDYIAVQKLCGINESFLDLNNHGMNYYYVQRKPAIAYTSFYNIVNTAQTREAFQNIIKCPPGCIYVSNYPAYFDNVTLSLRINAIYRWIFLSGMYQSKKCKSGIILVKNNNTSSLEYLDELDNIIGLKDAGFLPDVWGASISSLKMMQVKTKLQTAENEIKVSDTITPRDADLLYIKYESEKPLNIELRINNLPNVLKFKSQKNELLIPIDGYPSWLLVKRFDRFTLNADKEFKILEACLYKRT